MYRLGLGLIAMTFVLTGCSRVTGYHVTFAAEPEDVVEAAEDALEDLEMLDISSSGTEVDGALRARTAQNKKVEIDIKREGPGVSEMEVKVGTFGDEDLSNAIIAKTREELDLDD